LTFAGFLSLSDAVPPYGLPELRLQGVQDLLRGQKAGLGDRVITPQAAEQLIYMMCRVVEDGTGKRAKLDGYEAAGKTGTTSAAKDAWFIGFTADYVVGVWMGYDDNTPLNDVTGGGLPADIWRETMARVNVDQPASPLPMIRPAKPPRVQPIAPQRSTANSGNVVQPSQPPQQPRRQRNTEDRILDLLGTIFGN